MQSPAPSRRPRDRPLWRSAIPRNLVRLSIEDRGALDRPQAASEFAQLFRRAVLAVDALGQRNVDQPAAQLFALVDLDLGDILVECRQRGGAVALVELVDRAIVADQSLEDAVAFRPAPLGLREQSLGGGEIAKVGLLQTLVGERFAERRGVRPSRWATVSKNSADCANWPLLLRA